MLGMIIALLSAIFFQLNLMHQDKELANSWVS
jgi:hypothetical protein